MIARRWEREKLFHSGDEYFASLLGAIAQARVSIDMESYIFDRDALGMKVLAGLREAATRGVRVRLIVDGFGSIGWNPEILRKLAARGVAARIYHPLPWQLSSRQLDLGLRSFARGLGLLNRRDHRKTCLIDGRTAFVGGMNVSKRHLRSPSGEPGWRDTAAMVQGPEVRCLVDAFEAAWQGRHRSPSSRVRAHAHSMAGHRSLHSLLRLNNTWRSRHHAYRELLRNVRQARRRIWLTTPYFLPRLSLVSALKERARAGVDVRVLLPAKNDVAAMQLVNESFYPALLRAGVRVFEYKPVTLHAKLMVIDDWATVGSSNLNQRSLIHDLEVDVVLTRAASVRDLLRHFTADLARSREVTRANHRGHQGLEAALEKVALAFRKWL
jgi:cardiolipin synthase A/B